MQRPRRRGRGGTRRLGRRRRRGRLRRVGHVQRLQVGVAALDGWHPFSAANVVDRQPSPLPTHGVGGVARGQIPAQQLTHVQANDDAGLALLRQEEVTLHRLLVALDPGHERVGEELERLLLDVGVRRPVQVAEHVRRDAVDARDVAGRIAPLLDQLRIGVAHGQRRERHALLQQRHAPGVVCPGVLLLPIAGDALDHRRILDRRRGRGPGERAGQIRAIAEHASRVAFPRHRHPDGLAVQRDRRQPRVSVVGDPAYMVDVAHGVHPLDAVRRAQDAVVRQAVDGAHVHDDPV